MKTRQIIRAAMDKWTYRLGLRWWNVDSIYHSGKGARRYFKSSDGSTIFARTFADWRYGDAFVHFNVPAFVGMSADDIERVVVHELCHVLVNEMTATGIDHEERVVTGLTKAFLWTEQFSREG